MTTAFDDSESQPPINIRGRGARAYEEKIVELLRQALVGNAGPHETVDSIELRGERPDTEIIINYTDTRKPGRQAVKLSPRT